MSVLAQLNLKKGDVLSADDIKRILSREQRAQVQESAFRYLARRAHSEKELGTKLRRKGYRHDLVDEILADLRKKNYLNDEQFAALYARDRLASKPIGERRLRYELHQKGLQAETIDGIVRAAYAEVSEVELAGSLAERRKAHYQDLEETSSRKRMQAFLLRRGFSWDTVNEVMQTF